MLRNISGCEFVFHEELTAVNVNVFTSNLIFGNICQRSLHHFATQFDN